MTHERPPHLNGTSQPIAVPTYSNHEKSLPSYSSEQASGADVRAALNDSFTLEPGSSAAIPTGLFVAIPDGYEIQVRPRSGLAFKYQVTVLNTPGTIDADYRGEIKIILINHGKQPFVITPNMRIAQLVLAPVVKATYILTETLNTTTRGAGGFGHTGTH